MPLPPSRDTRRNKSRFRQNIHIKNSDARVLLLGTALFSGEASHAIHSNLRGALRTVPMGLVNVRALTLEGRVADLERSSC